MQVTVLTDTSQIGKTQISSSTKHPIKGVIHNKSFTSVEGFAAIIEGLTAHECFTVGLYPDNYKYVPSQDTSSLAQPRTTTRSKATANPGHILCIDCDHLDFSTLQGEGLHTFLSTHLPDIFSGAGYVTTKSTSSYIKNQDKFHQYYLFKTPSDMKNLFILMDRLFKQHNMITTKLASNFSRSYIYTPVDTKLHELQQPIFEMSKERLQTLGIDKPLSIVAKSGHIIDVSAMSLPNPDLPDVQSNYNRHKSLSEQLRSKKLADYIQEHGLPSSQAPSLEKGILPPTLELIANTPEEKQSKHKTTIITQVSALISTSIQPYELYQAIGEPDYAQHQTAKLFYDSPFKLSTYRLYDHAHGGINYIPVFNYEQLYELLTLAKTHELNPLNFMGIATARSDMNAEEIAIISQQFAKQAGVTPAKLSTFMTYAANQDILLIEEHLSQIPDNDLATLMASIEGNTKLALTPSQKNLLKTADLSNKQVLFRVENLEILRDIIARIDNDIVTKPGPLNSFNITTKQRTVKNLAQIYPLTNISPKANELTMDAMIDSITAERNLDTVIYKSSLHGEKLYFSDNRMEITYQQAKPSFYNVPEPVKYTLDNISSTQESEIRDIYMNQSIGDIWSYIAELAYIKKVYPNLKKDFLWLNFASDVGKSFNMDIANSIVPSQTTSLDQLMEQAAKVRPSDIVKSSFLLHDEVKHFKHSWNELGAMYSIKGMHSNAVSTQLPLKILMSAEDTLSKGTKQQMNRLMVYRSKAAKPFKELVPSKDWAVFGAVTHQIIYEKFTEAYNKYARLPQNEALQKAIMTASSLAAQLAPNDMMVTEEVVKDAISGYLLQEYVYSEYVDDALSRYVKNTATKDGVLYINFKKVDAPMFIEYVLKVTTSSLESRSMNYEALSITWADLGAYNLTKPKTIGGVSGFYGQVLELQIKQGE